MKIILCPTCNGTGETFEDIGTHVSEIVQHDCKTCEGSGRLYTETYQYNIPYKGNDVNSYKLYRIDAEIHELLRELRNNPYDE